MKRVLAFCLLCVALLLAWLPVYAVYGDELEELRRQQEQIERQIQQRRQEIQAKDREIKSLSQQMEELNRNIEAVEKDLENLAQQLAAATHRVEQAEQELKEAEDRLAERTDIFKNRLVEIYTLGDVSYLEVLMESTSMTDFLVRMELLQKIAEHDMKLLDELEAERAAVEEKKAELERERDHIAQIKGETENKKARLAAQQEEKAKLVNALRTEKAVIERALAEEEETSRRIAAQIREILARLGDDRKFSGGKLAWPAPGYTRITSEYGMRMHPILKTQRMHTGIDIAAPAGAKVIAAESGQVMMAGYYGAYGNTVIINHGSGITTLYAHLSAITVKQGDEVLRGDQIGKVGSTGLSTGPHLHFEVRENGEPVNPWSYLK
ncbi:MAG TPA: peptidoglycan DD-metalloendopeptidase family protein [Clostridia bacterium]|nr:peptidoglycan DD-metalloendopeptidase family protein [Clostridia bacterium]